MTRKDYVAIEESLRERLEVLEGDLATCEKTSEEKELKARIEGYLDACERLADTLADNPRFDREHFLAVVRGEKPLNSKPEHVKVLHGLCPICKHHGEDCTGKPKRANHPTSYAKRTGTIDTCTCADRSWYGEEHDSACPYAGQLREGIA